MSMAVLVMGMASALGMGDFMLQPSGDLRRPFASEQIGEDERPVAAHAARVRLHHLEARSYMRSKVGLVDDEQVGSHDARAALARYFFPLGNVDDVDEPVRQLGAERGSQIVAAALDEDKLERREPALQLLDRLEIHRSILAHSRMRAAARLHAYDPLFRKNACRRQYPRILLGIDVVGNDRQAVFILQRFRQALHQLGLAGADRSADADPDRPPRRDRIRLPFHMRMSLSLAHNVRLPGNKLVWIQSMSSIKLIPCR
ncbi:hypothetical protein BN871_AC_00340 [Paenibacillus sp. P22]|nr:hypothetical protein BN871_AC_00340 [Paenibacillus sp. P22]